MLVREADLSSVRARDVSRFVIDSESLLDVSELDVDPQSARGRWICAAQKESILPAGTPSLLAGLLMMTGPKSFP